MPEGDDELSSGEQGRKQSRRGRLRDILSKKPEKTDSPKAKDVEREADLNDFLKSPTGGDTLPAFPLARKPVPRISVSTSPFTAGEQSNGADEADLVIRTNTVRKRGLDLNVKFAETPPFVFGVGGDQCEAPTVVISQRKASAAPSPQHAPEPTGVKSASGRGDGAATDDDFQPGPLKRVATGFSGSTASPTSASTPKQLQDAEFELTLESATPIENAHASNPELLSASDGRRRRMRQEEGRALSSGLRDPSPEPSSLSQPDRSEEVAAARGERVDSTGAPPAGMPSAGVYPHSPPISQHEYSPTASLDHLAPPGTSPSPSRPSSSSSHDPPQSLPGARQPRSLVADSTMMPPPASTSPRRKPVAQQPPDNKDEALAEFRNQVRQYYSLFTLAAERTEPGLNAALSKWVRTAVWWFLAAEVSFKTLRKDLSDGHPLQQVVASRRMLQSMVDLGKALWIVEDIVNQYAHNEDIDISTPNAVDLVMRKDPISRFSRTLQVWQDLTKQIGGLVGAARRSGLLRSDSEDVPLSTGTDTSIWLEYPIHKEWVAGWLRSASPAWVQMDDSVTPAEPFDVAKVIPLRSTTNTFRIRSMFASISGGFDEQDLAVNMSCILTVGRRSGSHALVLFIASQTHDVNVVIETDPVRGDGMEWHQANSLALFNFADGFQLHIRLPLHEFLIFREVYDLALRALTGTTRDSLSTANLADQIIFRGTAKSFERRARDRKPNFPYQGEQRNCDIVLLEQYTVHRNGPTSHRTHRGIRLAVILGSQSASLGILDVHLGGGKPILAHDAQESASPYLELLDLQGATLIIQFAQAKDYSKFYQLLSCLDSSAPGKSTETSISLRAFSMEFSSKEAKKLLHDAEWKDVQIIVTQPRSQTNSHAGPSKSTSITIRATSNDFVIAERFLHAGDGFHFSLSPNPTSSMLSILHLHPPPTSVLFDHRSSPPPPPGTFETLFHPTTSRSKQTTYTFSHRAALHTFLEALTTFSTLHDTATTSVSLQSGHEASSHRASTSSTLLKKSHQPSSPNSISLGSGSIQLLHSTYYNAWIVTLFLILPSASSPSVSQALSVLLTADSSFELLANSSSSTTAQVKNRISNTIGLGRKAASLPPSAPAEPGLFGLRIRDVRTAGPSSSQLQTTESGAPTPTHPDDHLSSAPETAVTPSAFISLASLLQQSDPQAGELSAASLTVYFDDEAQRERFVEKLPPEIVLARDSHEGRGPGLRGALHLR